MGYFERGFHYGIYDARQRFEVGIGTFMISPADAEISVYKALKNGDRLIDTANARRGDGRKVRLDADRV